MQVESFSGPFQEAAKGAPRYINTLLVQVMQSCRSSLPPGATNAQPSTAMAPANTTSGVPSPAAPSSAAQAAKDFSDAGHRITFGRCGSCPVQLLSRVPVDRSGQSPSRQPRGIALAHALQVLAEQKAWQTIQAAVDHAPRRHTINTS